MRTDYDAGQELTRTHECVVCRHLSQLVCAKVPGVPNAFDVRCGKCRGEQFRRRKSLTALWRENPANVDIATANRLAEKHGADIEAVAAGLPPELAAVVRAHYFGQPLPSGADKTKEKKEAE